MGRKLLLTGMVDSLITILRLIQWFLLYVLIIIMTNGSSALIYVNQKKEKTK